MAEMVPPTPPPRSTASEKKIFDLLKRLDDDCIVYSQPRLGDCYADFVVIMPDLGMLILEVKGWRAHEILEADTYRVTHRAFGEEKRVLHPSRQAFGYMTGLMDDCRRYTWGKCLLETDGKYKGAFTFPFSHAVVFTNISRQELDDRDPAFERVFPEKYTLTGDSVERLFRLEDKSLKTEFRKYFARLFACTITTPQIKVLRAIMNPVALIERPRKEDASDIRVLDTAQESKARFLFDGHQIIYGVAGSGKTVILIARAKVVAADSSKNVLVLCYNNLLAQFIRLKLREFRNVSVFTFQGWAKRNGIDWIDSEAMESHAHRFQTGFKNDAVGDARRYDTVLVDEAQLLPCDWLKCARLSLKEQSPQAASLLVVGDGTEAFFRRRRFSWADAGIAAPGRTTILKKNYRNAAEIMRVAKPFAAPAYAEDEGGPRASTPLPECTRNGPMPELIELKSRDEECDYAGALIRSWLLGGLIIRGEREAVGPSDIAVLYPTPGAPIPELLAEKLRPFASVAVLKDYTDRLDQEGVRIVSIQRATGLQFRVVILIWTDLLPSNFTDRDDRTLLYLGMTRAEDVLVILHSGHSKLVDEIKRGLSGQNATSP